MSADSLPAAPSLSLRHISKTFPGQKALDDVSFDLMPGEIHALLGQNGSGKSTLIKALSGYHSPDQGAEASAGGEDVEVGSASASSDAGIRFIHQDLGLVEELNAAENLWLGAAGQSRWVTDRVERRASSELLEELDLDIPLDVPVAGLAASQRTNLAIARAMRDGRAACRVLVLDEPTASLPAGEVAHLFSLLRRIRADGGAVMYVSHRLDEVFEISDKVTVLRDGRVVTTCPTASLDHDRLAELIVGRPLDKFYPSPPQPGTEVVLRAHEVSGGSVRGVSLELRAGEIVGVAGLLGSGREDLPYLLFGTKPLAGGTIEVEGRSFSRLTPIRAISAGLGFVPADRKNEGGLPAFTARENTTLPHLETVGPGRWLGVRRERREVGRWLKRVEMSPFQPEREFALFSGGNQQKAILARWLRCEPKILIVAEPTQGVDVGAKAAIYKILAEEAEKRRVAILVSSSDSEELAALSDRILVMGSGRVEAELEAGSATSTAIDHLLIQAAGRSADDHRKDQG